MGKIILLNTPIGNLGDLTPRVMEALKNGSLFAVEDTRVFKELLGHLGISLQGKRVMAFHEHSETGQVDKLIEMAEREDLHVTSDAGSPIISDPAYPLVSRAAAVGVKIESYSGVSSPIMALELSGLPPIPFHFHGFLPRETSKKARIFSDMTVGTHIFFEAPTRVEDTLDELALIMPGLKVAVVRELSKKFEQVMRFKASDWPQLKADMTYKGEFVVLIHQPEGKSAMGSELQELAQEMITKGATPKQLSKLLGLILDRPTKDIYSLLNRQKDQVEE
ncbi:MAG TPA: 16S rRNA (cytidine(1402)-2'-O)-methyltransferase [Bacteriovoracaceae bacterium]|nr:16S rRNA (cytidine(1402)-2'-O)-methyltransferase [Bacteriovoracaceae bacterium]